MGLLRRELDGRGVILFTDHVIGRMASCTLSLDAAFVSMAHALIRWNGQHWELRDLGSTNGTYLGGARVTPGQSVALREGDAVAFGDPRERWQLANDGAPTAAAVPLEGGEPSFFSNGCVAVPCAEEPIATIYPDAEGWWLESDELATPLAPGQLFQVAGRSWRFECPAGTAITATTSSGSLGLDDVTLLFGVSRDQEHVSLTLQSRGGEQPLRERTCYYLALILAKQRLADRARVQEDAGWVDVDTFVRMVPEYAPGSALNVEIFRLRRALGEAGLHDAAAIVQRRRRQLRLGTERFEIRET